jgi:hypothetical protein
MFFVIAAQFSDKYVMAQISNKEVKLANENRRPTIKIEEALDIAEKYVDEHRINISEKYIDSVKLNSNFTDSRKTHWQITWENAEFTKGGQIFVLVYMDKSVKVGYGE